MWTPFMCPLRFRDSGVRVLVGKVELYVQLKKMQLIDWRERYEYANNKTVK